MAKQIEVPGQGIVEFPDSMSDEQIADVLKKQVPSKPQSAPAPAVAPTPDRRRAYLQETDQLLGLPPGTSERQIQVESNFNPKAVSPAGARGLAQVMPATQASLEKRLGRPLDPFNEDDSLLMHREVMKDNIKKFGNVEDALRAYNAGWNPKRWNNPETINYVSKIAGGIPNKEGYVPFAPVRKNIDVKSLESDPDWINAALVLYTLWENKPFEGTPKEAAEWGKDFIWWFDNNIPNMAMKARDVIVNGTDEEKAAMLYMMDTLDNVNMSGEGAWRAFKAQVSDPTNLVSVGSLGAGMLLKQGVKKVEKEALKFTLKESLKKGVARTGIVAGIDAAIIGGTTDAIRQSVEVSAGRRDEIDFSKVGVSSAVTGVGGLFLGTGLDVGAQAVSPYARKATDAILGLFKRDAPNPAARVEPLMEPQVAVAGVSPAAEVTPQTARFTISEETKPGLAGISEPVSATAQTDAGLTIRLERDFKGAYKILSEDGEQIGRIGYTKTPLGEWKVTGVEVDPKYQRQGVASTVYDFLEQNVIKDKFAITGSYTEAGRAFREGRQAKAGMESDTPRGSTLTPAEVAEATARKQDGRLPADETVPPMTGGQRIEVPDVNTGLRSTRVNGEPVANLTTKQVDEFAATIVQQIRDVPQKDVPATLEMLRRGLFDVAGGGTSNPETQRVVGRALKMYKDELAVDLAEAIKARKPLLEKGRLTPEEVTRLEALNAKVDDLERTINHPEMASDAFGSNAGATLQDYQRGLQNVTGSTPESIAKEKNIPIEKAREEWADIVGKAAEDQEIKRIAADYDRRAAEAIEAGNLEQAARITAQKWKEMDARVEQLAPRSATIAEKLTELAISNVFSIRTILVNLIPSGLKTLVIPGLKFIQNNPLEKAARAELMASYSAMRSSFGGALKAAWSGYKYEQALLTRDGIRLVEGELALKGRTGGLIRFFPRIINATDEFLSRLNYNSFIAGRAAAEAAMEGQAKGLKGKALDDFVKKASDKAVAESRSAGKGDELVVPIINKGLNRGLTGEDLFKFVEKEAIQNPEALLKGTDQEALDFVRDVLYKRQFSGEGFSSKAAQYYEEGTKKFPSIKLLVGQLFFRTPVRVFEEGIRLTPGLQFLAPNFIQDLTGNNGTLRQIRARSEAMTSLALAGAVMSLYSQGRITGDGAYDDYKQTKNRLDSAKPEPYTIRFSDGSTWSFKGFDPIATPVKIMVNAMERLDQLRLREAQGEFIDAEAYKYPIAAITVAAASVATAIRDASLVEGLNQTIKFAESFADPEQSEDKFIKALGDKLFLLVPNTLHKIAKDNDPTIRDPKTFYQMVEEKLLRPFGQEIPGVKTSKAYDILGNTRRMADTGNLWNVFSTATVEERAKGMSEDQQYVLGELDRLSKVTGVTWNVRTKHPTLGDLDLRTVMASDGKSTMWDKWQEIYRSLEPEKVLKPILEAPMPEGTFKDHDGKTEVVQRQITQLQNAAFDILMSQEDKLIKRMINEELRKANAEAGMFDTPRP